MKTKTIEVCNAVLYNVNCEYNDSADVKCGGPPILGYEFYVSPDEDKKDMIKFIEQCIKKYDRPLIDICTRIVNDFPVEKLWNKVSIEECIKEYSV